MAPPIRYKLFDGKDGLQLRGSALTAWAGGVERGRAEVSEAADLGLLMRSYEVQDLLPDLIFCHSKPEWHELAINFRYSLRTNREVHGYVVFLGQRLPWVARRGVHPDFMLPDQPCRGQRSWLRPEDEKDGVGLEFAVPSDIIDYPDPVVVRRTALALERFIYNLRDDWPMELPYRSSFTNLFSAREPMWPANLPRLISLTDISKVSFVFAGSSEAAE